MNHLHQNAARLLAIAALAISGALASPASMTLASTTLKTATTADKTATVGLPSGWKLAKGSNGFVYVNGAE